MKIAKIAIIVASVSFAGNKEKAATLKKEEKIDPVKRTPSIGIKDAIAGFRFGWSPKDLELAGIKATIRECKGIICTYDATNSPKNLSWVESYSLSFVHDSLYKVSAISTDIENDSYGVKGQNQFNNISEALQAKYSLKSSYMYVGEKLYKESDEFYECLAYDGCGSWIRFFKDSTKNISLELKPLGSGLKHIGYIYMSVESNPEWSNALDAIKAKENQADGDAL